MNSLATKRKTLTVLLAVMAAVCLAVALALTLPAEKAHAQEGNDGASSARTPVVTYVIGDTAVTDESGFTEETDENGYVTYTYADHAAGWSAALAKSAELYDAETADANLVKVRLASDWVAAATAEGRLFLSNTKANIIFDLNNKKFDRGLSDTTAISNTGMAMYLAGGIVEITDTSDEGGGIITGGNNTSGGGGILLAKGTLILSGGSISNNKANNGAGVYVQTGSRLILNGGTISSNKASSNGGAVYIEGGTFTMNSGKINENIANRGGAIYTSNSANFIMNGGTIKLNSAASHGGAVYHSGINTQINDGEISGNSVTNGIGGGIFVADITDSQFILNGGKIFGNSATTSGGGIKAAGILTVSGSAVVEENVLNGTINDSGKYGDGTLNNISLDKGLNVGKLENAKIHFSTIATQLRQGKIGLDYGANNSDKNGIAVDPNNYFIIDNSNDKLIVNADGELMFTDQGVLDWTVTGSSNNGAAIADAGYGSLFTYSENTVTGIALKQGTTDIASITVTDADGQTISDLSANPLTNAGTYYATATVKGIGNVDVQVKFAIVILPYNIEEEIKYKVTADGWNEGDGQYTATYDGNSKTAPTLTATLNGSAFADSNYSLSFLLNDATVTELKEVGEYTVVITGTGNYTGKVYVSEKFNIMPDNTRNYTVTWQYYDGKEWKNLADTDGAAFTYANADYSGLVRVVLSVTDGEIRYVYANGITEYNLAADEEGGNITHGLTVGIVKDSETAIVNAGEYALTLNGTPNYTVADKDKTSSVTVAKYNLANIVNGSTDTATIDAALDNTTYNALEKTLTLTASVTLSGNYVTLGTSGAEYDYVVKYINADGSETEIKAFILGGTYKIYITATGNNLTGTLGVVGTVTITQANNTVSLNGTGNWTYGTYDVQVNGITGSATYLYDGTIAGTQQTFVYYTVKNADGEAVNATLTRFTSLTDEVVKAMNALGAGKYTLIAEVDETASYAGASREIGFTVVKATNGWLKEPSVIGWEWNGYDSSFAHLVATAKYGNEKIALTVKDADGKAVSGLENFTEVTEEIVTALKALNAGNYTLSVSVADTSDYGGLEETVNFTVAKAHNDWAESPSVKAWVAGYYDATANAVKGSAKYGEVTYKITDADGNEVTDLANAEVGTYTLTMTVAGTDNYEGLTYTSTFNVFESTDLTGGEIAGIVIMSVIVAGLAAAVVVLLIKRRKAV